ncbi:MAG: HAMP domain-containing histidine kinase [Chloroflexi bacterium]|nr:HAMP domain-containing histidine kinase [Chloroflexota bacterium]MCI0577306.1 HAMP domain-containing histidine kinase [Chloroflexota bacterium]MCI0644731.1 HAMP domain-containing histidine kinase [Chloroflexota bacterium]MCI0726704.1 HAMP domain-containing histidine kinase [Chloroflexota bacterium]
MRPRELLYKAYFLAVSVLGISLVLWGISQIPTSPQPLTLLLLVLLAAAAESTATITLQGIDFSVSTVVSLAAAGLYGPSAATVVVAGSQLALWRLMPDKPGWRVGLRRLAFNLGMQSLVMFLAGAVFAQVTEWLAASPILGQTIPWLLAAAVADQLNLWMVIAILYLQRGVRPLEVWRESRWAVPINVLVTGVGGGILAFAVRELELLGVVLVFLPILASAYAFRLYLDRTQKKMAELEGLIRLRTEALEEANVRLAETNVELAQREEEKNAFLAILTHDMRAPLTSIYGFAQLILREPEMDPAERERMLKVIVRAQASLLEMANNILELRQLESGAAILLEQENFDLIELIAEVIESAESLAVEKGIGLWQRGDMEPIFIRADRSKLRRVITNLVSNAIKYTLEGQVSVTAKMNGYCVIVDIQDTGYGIPAEDLPYIFEPFRRVRKHETRAVGTGLGLTIVKSLVEAHGGTIEVASQEGVGSTFSIELPI